MVHIDEHDTRGDYFTYCANEANGELGAYVEHNKIVQMCKWYLQTDASNNLSWTGESRKSEKRKARSGEVD